MQKTRLAAAALPPAALPHIAMATSALALNQGAVTLHKSAEGALWRVCNRHG
jgi:hypothetical protein